MKIAFLGPDASFTSLAAGQVFPADELVPYSSIRDCFMAVLDGQADRAVVPLENSIEGTVSMTLDYLYEFQGLYIQAEVVMPIAHHLLVHPQSSGIDRILSHPQAHAQCFHFMEDNYRNIPRQDYNSTAASAKYASEHPEENVAAIANTHAAKAYGLKIVHHNIHDFEQNHTKFIVLGREKEECTLSFQNVSEKTSLLITLPDDHAGGLHQVLSVFAWRKMNLSKIESRTQKKGLGNYFFFLNVATPWHPVHSQNAIEELKSIGAAVTFLGHYNEFLLSD